MILCKMIVDITESGGAANFVFVFTFKARTQNYPDLRKCPSMLYLQDFKYLLIFSSTARNAKELL